MNHFELRTYRVAPGRVDDLVARFRNHTIRLLKRHGMSSRGYWSPQGEPEVLVYLLEHRGDPSANWAAFQSDPEWIAARRASLVEGPLTTSIEAVLLEPNELNNFVV